MTQLQRVGYTESFADLDAGVADYYHYLKQYGGYLPRNTGR